MVELRGLLRGKKAVFLDLDGVVYAGSSLLGGAKEMVVRLRDLGIQVRFLSNNSLKHPSSISGKLEKLGIACPTEHVLTSGMLACRAIRDSVPGQGEIAIVGTEELETMAREAGLVPVDRENVPAVLVGMTPDFSYRHIVRASRAILAGAEFYACNRDGMFLGEGGSLFPGCGAMVGAIEGATGVVPRMCFGKPNPGMLEEALKSGGWELGECLMVGDTWTSDIEMCRAAGMDWAFVNHDPAFVPPSKGVIVGSTGELLPLLESEIR